MYYPTMNYIPFDPDNSLCRHVMVSSRAYAKIQIEVHAQNGKENGGIPVGHIIDSIWYITDIVTAGPNSTHRVDLFEWDTDYVNRSIAQMRIFYRTPPTVLGFFHRHPGSMDFFSQQDVETTQRYLQEARYGLISMLVNVDPKLRMTFYYCHEDHFMPVGYDVGDEYFPPELLEPASSEQIDHRMNVQAGRASVQTVYYRKLQPADSSIRSVRACNDPAVECSDVQPLTFPRLEPAGTFPKQTAAAFPADSHEDSPDISFPEEKEKEDMNFQNEPVSKAECVCTTENPVTAELIEQINSRMDREKPAPLHEVQLPLELMEHPPVSGVLYGYLRPDTGCHVILSCGTPPAAALRAEKIGMLGGKPDWTFDQAIFAEKDAEGKLRLYLIDAEGGESPLDCAAYTPRQDLFSRHQGLLESEKMMQDTAVIAGCGSVGSLVAIQLARSGIGSFILFDSDIFSIENVCRHQCDQTDLGRFKVDAVEDRILRINPAAKVTKFYRFIQDVSRSKYENLLDPAHTVFVGTCDRRSGNAYANDIAYELGIPFLSIGFMERAWAGELFVCLPERHDICYGCSFKTQIEASSADEHSRLYMNADGSQTDIMPGLGNDVAYGCSVACSALLDLFNRSRDGYTPRILPMMEQLLVFSCTGVRPEGAKSWSRILPDPMSFCALGISDACRRCEHCICEKAASEEAVS